MKYDAIVDQGIPIHERVPIPERLIPADSRVEIDAKIYAGYFTNEKIPNLEELSQVHGRAWYVYCLVTLPSLVRELETKRDPLVQKMIFPLTKVFFPIPFCAPEKHC